jgi:hypothetical protein
MRDGDRALAVVLGGVVVLGLLAGSGDVSAQKPAASSVKLGSSYAEWKLPGALIVDGQKVVVDGSTNFFFSDHSSASARRKSLEDEIRLNHYVR